MFNIDGRFRRYCIACDNCTLHFHTNLQHFRLISASYSSIYIIFISVLVCFVYVDVWKIFFTFDFIYWTSSFLSSIFFYCIWISWEVSAEHPMFPSDVPTLVPGLLIIGSLIKEFKSLLGHLMIFLCAFFRFLLPFLRLFEQCQSTFCTSISQNKQKSPFIGWVLVWLGSRRRIKTQ